MITIIELQNPLRIIEVRDAKKEEIVEWINQAPTLENRQRRKALMHGLMYNSGPQTFLNALDLKKRN